MEMGPFRQLNKFAFLIEEENRVIRFPIEVTVTDPSLPFDIDMVVGVSDLSEPIMVCTDMHLRRRDGGPPITSAALRGIPVREIVQEICERCAEPFTAPPDAEGLLLGAGVSKAATVRPPRRAGHALLDRDLPEVAEVWRAASDAGRRATTMAVVDHFHVSRATAARAVQRARAAGLIPEV